MRLTHRRQPTSILTNIEFQVYMPPEFTSYPTLPNHLHPEQEQRKSQQIIATKTILTLLLPFLLLFLLNLLLPIVFHLLLPIPPLLPPPTLPNRPPQLE
ncbi:unnamed protein product [Alternaria burnsii]|nr:unnamed protein product [Alternaria burnsii]